MIMLYIFQLIIPMPVDYRKSEIIVASRRSRGYTREKNALKWKYTLRARVNSYSSKYRSIIKFFLPSTSRTLLIFLSWSSSTPDYCSIIIHLDRLGQVGAWWDIFVVALMRSRISTDETLQCISIPKHSMTKWCGMIDSITTWQDHICNARRNATYIDTCIACQGNLINIQIQHF